jgi:hypothetical protein
VVSFTSRPFYPQGKSRFYPLDRRLGGPQSQSGRGGEEKNSHPLPGLESPIIHLVAQRYTTELSRLGYKEDKGFLDQLKDCQFLKKYSAPWSSLIKCISCSCSIQISSVNLFPVTDPRGYVRNIHESK